MNTKLLNSKTSMIFLIASALFIVGCADKRGFEAKRIKTPLGLEKSPGDQQQPGPLNDNPNLPLTGGQDSGVLNNEDQFGRIIADENIDEAVNETVENTFSQITYQEGESEQTVIPEKQAEYKEGLIDLLKVTKQLSAEQQFLKGISLVQLEGATAESLPVEVMASLEIDQKTQNFVASLNLSKTAGSKSFSALTYQLKWIPETTDLSGEVLASCSGSENDPCSEITVILQVERKSTGETQAFAVVFARTENGYEISRQSISRLLTFEEAQNGVAAVNEEAEEAVLPENTQEQQEQVQAQEDQPSQDQAQPSEQVETKNKEQQATESVTQAQAKKQGPTHRQAEQESMAKLEAMRAEQKKAAQEKAAQERKTHRQAEQESMEKLRAMQAEQKKTTPSARQAQEDSMQKLNQASKPTHRQAEIESMKKLEAMKASQKEKTPSFRQAEEESMKKLQQMQKKTHRQAEQQSMEALRKAQAKKAQKSFREAEEESMRKLKWERAMEKILKESKNKESVSI